MDSWFLFIRENPGVFVVLLAVAGPLWNYWRGRRKLQPGGRHAHPMPSFGGNPLDLNGRGTREADARRERPEAFREDEERRDRQREKERSAAERERLAREREAAGEGVSLEGRMTMQAMPQSRTPSTSGLPVRSDKPGAAEGIVPDKEELRRVFVWSEILGPPRSKGPFRRFR